MLNNATFHICPLFSQHVLGQKIHWQLPKERWPTVGTVNGRIGGTKMSGKYTKRSSLYESDLWLLVFKTFESAIKQAGS